MNRRDMIKVTSAAAASVFIPGMGFFGCSSSVYRALAEPFEPDFTSPVDRNEDSGGFYVEYVNGKSYRPAGLDLKDWSLHIFQSENGTVIPGKEVFLSYQDIINAYPSQEESFFQTFQCVGNIVGGNLVGNGYFTGVPLRHFLMDKLGIDVSKAQRVVFRCYDGYQTNHKINRILHDANNDDPSNPPIYLAYKFNGMPLNDGTKDGVLKHGFPVRIVCRNMMGMKSPKVLMQIEVTDSDKVVGWWESRPISRREQNILWADDPITKVNSKIFNPVNYQKISSGTHRIKGTAWSGDNPVAKVEIAIAAEDIFDENDINWDEAKLMTKPTTADKSFHKSPFDTSTGAAYDEAFDRIINNPTWPLPFIWCKWHYDLPIPAGSKTYRLFARATDSKGDVQPFSEGPLDIADGSNGIHSVVIQT